MLKFKKLSIGNKLQLYVLLFTGVVFTTSVGYISIKERQRALRDATALIDNSAANYAEEISNTFNQHLSVVRTLAQAFRVHQSMPAGTWMPFIVDMHKQIFENNSDFHALWDSWEYNYIDPNWQLPYGRMLNYYSRKEGKIVFDQIERSLTGDPPLYKAAKEAGREKIWEPYPDQLHQGAVGTTLMTTLTVPMNINNRYIGLVGVDITLEHLQQIISGIKPFEDAYAFLVSSKGLYAAHPNTGYFEMSIADNLSQDEYQYNIISRIAKGEVFSFSSSNEKGKMYYYSFVPVHIGDTQTPWAMGIAVPYARIQHEATMNFLVSLLILVIGLGFIALVVWRLSANISKPVNRITGLMNQLSRGEIDQTMKLELNTGDELQQMAEAFNVSIDGLNDKTRFAASIGKGNLDTELRLLSENDILGKSLIDMQVNLKKAREEEIIRQKEDQVRRWSTEGHARFAEILRSSTGSLENLSYEIIRNLVKYLQANQGGIFILNDNDKNDVFLELKACYAYDRKKFLEKRIEPGVGLVGTCYREAQTIYMTTIPQSYITITSGLGDQNPGALLIVPLVMNGQVYGVIELASFEEFQPYQKEFVEKIGESVASTISSVKISVHTALLLEKSQQQAEEMKSQEEEMRQNMEELHATQEEMARKGSETEGILKALDSSSYTTEYDLNGNILNISDSYLKLLNIRKEDAIGAHHSEKLDLDTQQKAQYDSFWSDLRNGQIKYMEVKVYNSGTSFWLAETYAPIYDQYGKIYKIFKIANNITESKTVAENLRDENNRLKQKIEELAREN
jgi:methyl-accepting chemotaxis protein